MSAPGNIYQAIPAALPEELLQTLHQAGRLKIERIVSRGHVSPPGFWYQQEQDEWVMLLQGEAELGFQDGRATRRMRAGDYLLLPAGLAHRVEWTSSSPECVWLAIFY